MASDATAVEASPRPLEVEWLGRVPYAEALKLQYERVEARRNGTCGDALLLLEHPPVVTRGRSSKPENLRLGRDELAARDVDGDWFCDVCVHTCVHGVGGLLGVVVWGALDCYCIDVFEHLFVTVEACVASGFGDIELSAATICSVFEVVGGRGDVVSAVGVEEACNPCSSSAAAYYSEI